MGCKVKFSPGKSVSFIQSFMSRSSLCIARKEISVRDSSEVWISVRHRIVKLSQVKLMRSQGARESARESGTAFRANSFGNPICHYIASTSPVGFRISKFIAFKWAQLGLRHFSQSWSPVCKSEVLHFSSKKRFSCISNIAFQACTLWKLRSFAKAHGQLKSGLLTPCKLYSLMFFLPVTCFKGSVIWSTAQVKSGHVMVNLPEQKSSLV